MGSGSQRTRRTSHPPGRNSEFPGYFGRAKGSDGRRPVEDLLAVCLRQEGRGKLCAMSGDGTRFAEDSWNDLGHVFHSRSEEAHPRTPRIVEGCSSLSPGIDCPRPGGEFENQGWERRSVLG